MQHTHSFLPLWNYNSPALSIVQTIDTEHYFGFKKKSCLTTLKVTNHFSSKSIECWIRVCAYEVRQPLFLQLSCKICSCKQFYVITFYICTLLILLNITKFIYGLCICLFMYIRSVCDCMCVSSALTSVVLEGLPLRLRDCKVLGKVS